MTHPGHPHPGHAHHGHAHHAHAPQNRLRIALALTAFVLAVEVVGSFVTGSLALLSDAGHMATDVAALAIALLAIHLGARRADLRRSYGYRRLEVLAAALNAAGLLAIGAYILWEAVARFREPVPIETAGMLLVALLGLAVNAIAMFLLRDGREQSLNLRAAYMEVWADFLGSIAVLAGALAIYLTGALWIDPAIAVLISLWVLPRGWALLRSALHVLLEGTPEGVDPHAVTASMAAVKGVCAVHDLHIWCLTTGVPLLTAHVEVESLADWDRTLESLRGLLASEHQIQHVTLQPELASKPCANTHHA